MPKLKINYNHLIISVLKNNIHRLYFIELGRLQQKEKDIVGLVVLNMDIGRGRIKGCAQRKLGTVFLFLGIAHSHLGICRLRISSGLTRKFFL
ncbi:MAG: hypothetical protein HKM92_04740 [Arenibacter sp.]|nr:hypothetical protein [Arenibacter sp.]